MAPVLKLITAHGATSSAQVRTSLDGPALRRKLRQSPPPSSSCIQFSSTRLHGSRLSTAIAALGLKVELLLHCFSAHPVNGSKVRKQNSKLDGRIDV